MVEKTRTGVCLESSRKEKGFVIIWCRFQTGKGFRCRMELMMWLDNNGRESSEGSDDCNRHS